MIERFVGFTIGVAREEGKKKKERF